MSSCAFQLFFIFESHILVLKDGASERERESERIKAASNSNNSAMLSDTHATVRSREYCKEKRAKKQQQQQTNRNKWTKTAFHTVAKRQAHFQYFHCHAAYSIDIRHRQYARARHMQIFCTHEDK